MAVAAALALGGGAAAVQASDDPGADHVDAEACAGGENAISQTTYDNAPQTELEKQRFGDASQLTPDELVEEHVDALYPGGVTDAGNAVEEEPVIVKQDQARLTDGQAVEEESLAVQDDEGNTVTVVTMQNTPDMGWVVVKSEQCS